MPIHLVKEPPHKTIFPAGVNDSNLSEPGKVRTAQYARIQSYLVIKTRFSPMHPKSGFFWKNLLFSPFGMETAKNVV